MNLIKEKENKDWAVIAFVKKEFKNNGNTVVREIKELAGSYDTYEKAKEMADIALANGFYVPYFNKNNPGQSHRRVQPSSIEVVNTKLEGGQ